MVSVADLRKELVKLGLSEDEAVSIKGKANLVARVNELSRASLMGDVNLDDVEVVEDDVEFVDDTKSDTPTMYDPEWSDYVLSQMADDEKMDGNPTVDGLRRMVGVIFGNITSSHTNVVQTPTPDNKERATVTVTIVVNDGDENLMVTGAADSYWGNTDKAYRNYPVAVAETRAEGRALKRLLKLRKVISAEEKADEIEPIGEDSVGKITPPQIQYLEITCRDKLGVNIKKLLNKHLPDVQNVNDISHADALELFKVLSSYQSTGVPEELQGYDSDWKGNLTGE